MIPRNHPCESYRKVATQTASPGQLVLMLFDGAIGFLEKALAGFNYTDPLLMNQTINNNILRAQAIINEMNLSLNMEAGDDIALTFRRLYNYFYCRLREANFAKRKEPIEETIMRLQALRDSWAEMLRCCPPHPNANEMHANARV